MHKTIDPVEYSVVTEALQAIAREMGTKLVQSAFSTIVREAKDCSAAILDPRGDVIAQAEMIPLHLGSMGETLRACLRVHPVETIGEGDFLINNHPYFGGQHLQDVFIYQPVFSEGELVAFVGNTVHHVEFGGSDAGINNSATDVFQEGFQIPPLRLNYAEQWEAGAFRSLLLTNVRLPEQTVGDLNAQFSANAIGRRRLVALCDRYGRDTVRQIIAALSDYTEQRMRKAISRIPDGEYFGTDTMDNDGSSDRPVHVRVKVTVRGETLNVDFEGTDGQVARNLNSPYASTVSSVMCCLKSLLLDQDIPFNEGSFRPVTMNIPLGTILNPRRPAPVRARMEICYRAYDAVMKALAPALPERAISSGFNAILAVCLTAREGERFKVCIETFGGGFGAGIDNDGADGIAQPLSNTTNSPVEALDLEYDFFRVVGYGLERGSQGHGARRGGMGIVRRYAIERDGVEFSMYGDRFAIRPEGLFGGTEAGLARAEVVRGGVREKLNTQRPQPLKAGDVVEIISTGGAGYGDPKTRPRAMVEADIADGFLSRDDAEKFYGYGVS